MKQFFLILIFNLLICCQSVAQSFSFHLMQEPHTLEPALMRGTSGSYLFLNLYRSIYKYSNEQGLVAEGAKSCVWQSSLFLKCELNPEIKWSNGKSVEAKHYLEAFRRLVNKSTIHGELLLSLKNAKHILKEEKTIDQLGVKVISPRVLHFYFDKADPDFLYKLSFPSLAPIYNSYFPTVTEAHKLIVNGPYRIVQWKKGKRIYLERNPYYLNNHKTYPEVTVYFIEDDETALRVFESGQLSLLRRLTSSYIDKYKSHKSFFQVPVARFDYLFFGPELKEHKNLRKALSMSLNYDQLKKIYHALGRPGCPSLPSRLMMQVPCHPFSPEEAFKLAETLPPDIKKRRWPIYFSKMGGDDVAKGMEWIQHQWKKHLSLTFDLKPEEQGVYLQKLKMKPPAIFRKGVNLDRPTCLAGLENFTTGHPENFLQLDDIKYNEMVGRLARTQDEKNKRQLCTSAVQYLMDEFYLIPLGEIHFTMLEDANFTGWQINELNQLDLTHLQAKK